ncbi:MULTISPECIES: hypothetical protein [Streptomyces]|uniref:Uncharacterized protein n=1 Tax=Streptomyces antibioticus TaxID=1890 RepID=A0AAE6Y4T7_STRAT|nr:hypothetical protein [Streptomyces antibioticus]OOQ55345.1 hypothetical protein AFM16_04925 [Streptomyces antibioticus]QIT42985.1 hypothetical protein HCX60_05135 [Streptomyces antibioticus]
MSETTPQSEITDLGALQATEGGPASPDVSSIPVTEIKPEGEATLVQVAQADVTPQDVGTFSVRYVGQVPQLVVTGGSVVPSVVTVVDGSGNVLAEYVARPAAAPKPVSSRLLPLDQHQIIGCVTPDCFPVSLRA